MLQELRGSINVSKLVMSPVTACPKLAHLDLYGCPKLSHVLIQSQSLLTLNLTSCTHLTKVSQESNLASTSMCPFFRVSGSVAQLLKHSALKHVCCCH